jgi:hypothetical protein
VHPNQDTEELQSEQLARELEERRLADAAPQESETEQHQRRAEKARYLREKLAQRAESEREVGPEDEGSGDRAG